MGRRRGAEAERWHQVFRQLVDPPELNPSSVSAQLLVGIEHEYEVRRGAVPIAFDAIVRELALGRPYLDPADANAFRLPTGAAVTCDEREAEIALPPVAVRAGFTGEIAGRIANEEAALRHRLGSDYQLVGVSTHISVQVDAPIATIDALARMYAEVFGTSMMLLLDRRDSWGIYVRPRPGRLEICGEFACGERLRAAVVFAVGSVSQCLAVVEGRAPASAMPPRLRIHTTSGGNRFGYTVWRTSGLGDLYVEGRAARVCHTADGTVTTAQAQLGHAWRAARDALPLLAYDDLASADRFVRGPVPLPVADDDLVVRAELPPIRDHGYGRFVRPITHPGYEMAAVMVTWPVVVLLAADDRTRRRSFVCIPQRSIDSFLAQLDLGALDGAIRGYLGTRPARRRLDGFAAARNPGLWDELGPRRSFLASEPLGPSGSTMASAA